MTDTLETLDQQEELSVEALKKRFALKSGWPEVHQYQLTDEAWELLRDIPGSFAAEDFPEDCPAIDPILRAQYDLVPRLLEEGHQGKWLAFGYGSQWYVVGKNPHEAKTKLMIHYPYQMPVVACEIEPGVMEEPIAKAYYRWRLAREAPAAPSEPSMV